MPLFIKVLLSLRTSSTLRQGKGIFAWEDDGRIMHPPVDLEGSKHTAVGSGRSVIWLVRLCTGLGLTRHHVVGSFPFGRLDCRKVNRAQKEYLIRYVPSKEQGNKINDQNYV
jgi:hypothetical protein